MADNEWIVDVYKWFAGRVYGICTGKRTDDLSHGKTENEKCIGGYPDPVGGDNMRLCACIYFYMGTYYKDSVCECRYFAVDRDWKAFHHVNTQQDGI